MKRAVSNQLIISGVGAPGSAFIACTRFANDSYGWGLFWLVLAFVHALAALGECGYSWRQSAALVVGGTLFGSLAGAALMLAVRGQA